MSTATACPQVVEAVLCRTGKVVPSSVKGLPNGLTEETVQAARRIKFRAGMKGGEAVSVKVHIVYTFCAN